MDLTFFFSANRENILTCKNDQFCNCFFTATVRSIYRYCNDQIQSHSDLFYLHIYTILQLPANISYECKIFGIHIGKIY